MVSMYRPSWRKNGLICLTVYLGHEWRNKMCDTEYWSRVDTIPDHLFWSVRQSLKSQMFYGIRSRVTEQNTRNRGSEAHLDRLLKFVDPINPNVLDTGLRAPLRNLQARYIAIRKPRLVAKNSFLIKERPVLLLFAGKAHPADVPGQDLIRRISQNCELPNLKDGFC